MVYVPTLFRFMLAAFTGRKEKALDRQEYQSASTHTEQGSEIFICMYNQVINDRILAPTPGTGHSV